MIYLFQNFQILKNIFSPWRNITIVRTVTYYTDTEFWTVEYMAMYDFEIKLYSIVFFIAFWFVDDFSTF